MPEFGSLPPALSKRFAYGEPNGTYCRQRAQMDDSQISFARMTRLARRWIGLALLVTIAGCGTSTGDDYGGKHPDYAKALAGSPAPLAALHDQSNRLLGGGVDAYERRIAALRGYPAVVNFWASWCGPCRFEFPLFQRAAAADGRRVAFLGVDTQDSDDAASTFLEEAPVPYPSYTDPEKAIGESVGADLGLPDTAFYDRRGELVHLKQGPYRDAAELRGEIERYALGHGGESG
jgi:thiol-disulfide isomerase/thioredoxin